MDLDLSIYVHMPFCDYKCTFCDFAAFANQDHLMAAYSEALIREVALRSADGTPRSAATIFFGGGTPSKTAVDDMARILDALHRSYAVAPGAEVTVEANPGSIDRPSLDRLVDLGVTRLSVGVQTLNDRSLQTTNRLHSGQQALEALDTARQSTLPSVSADLMFGLPGQDLADWRHTLSSVVERGPDHLSVYGLIVEPGTVLARQLRRGEIALPDDDEAADMYEWTRSYLGAHGYVHYEISNWARPDHHSRHNLVYWHHQPYLGVGLSAHSFLDDERFANVRGLKHYLARIEAGRLPTAHSEPIDDRRARSDAIVLGLRLIAGIEVTPFDRRFGGSLLTDHHATIARFSDLDLLEHVDGHLRLTERGYLLANQVWQAFI